jgi:hypothetical protein
MKVTLIAAMTIDGYIGRWRRIVRLIGQVLKINSSM